MIKLEVQEYCQTCSKFEPDVEHPTELYADGELYTIIGDTIIRCEYRHFCERIYRITQGKNNNDEKKEE